MNFNNHLFRCSQLGNLMVKPKSKSEILSETTKTYLREVYIETVYGRKKDITNKYMDKGLYTEEMSLTLMQQYEGRYMVKNKKEYKNTFICGTPDVVLDDKVMDAKSSWDIYTFFGANGKDKDYYWQGLGYMALTAKTKFDLCYCLNNAPEHMIVSEKTKKMYNHAYDNGSPEMAAMESEVEKNMTFDDIPANKRIRVFSFDYSLDDYELLVKQIGYAREYLNSLDF